MEAVHTNESKRKCKPYFVGLCVGLVIGIILSSNLNLTNHYDYMSLQTDDIKFTNNVSRIGTPTSVPIPVPIPGAHSSMTNNYMRWYNESFDQNSYLKNVLQPKWKDLNVKELSPAEYNYKIYDRCDNIMNAKPNPKWQLDVWSQAMQDWSIYNNFFKGKINGLYMDIGANRPHLISNTAFFDMCLGWKGLCIEPTKQADLFKPNKRSCNVFKGCLNNQNDIKDELYITGMNGGGGDTANTDKKGFKCPNKNITDILNEYSFKSWKGDRNDIIKYPILIDFISMDIEGFEIHVLKCWPFHIINARVWAIETNKEIGNGENYNVLIDEIMLNNGYVKYQFIDSQIDKGNSKLDSVYVINPYKWVSFGANEAKKVTKCH